MQLNDASLTVVALHGQETWLQPLLRNIFGNVTVSIAARHSQSQWWLYFRIILNKVLACMVGQLLGPSHAVCLS